MVGHKEKCGFAALVSSEANTGLDLRHGAGLPGLTRRNPDWSHFWKNFGLI